LWQGGFAGNIVAHIGEISERNVRKYPNDTALIEHQPAGKKRRRFPGKDSMIRLI